MTETRLASMTYAEERALLVECHSLMHGIATTFNKMAGRPTDEPNYETMTDAEILTEMRDALRTVTAQVGPALQNPMVSMMLKRMNV